MRPLDYGGVVSRRYSLSLWKNNFIFIFCKYATHSVAGVHLIILVTASKNISRARPRITLGTSCTCTKESGGSM